MWTSAWSMVLDWTNTMGLFWTTYVFIIHIVYAIEKWHLWWLSPKWHTLRFSLISHMVSTELKKKKKKECFSQPLIVLQGLFYRSVLFHFLHINIVLTLPSWFMVLFKCSNFNIDFTNIVYIRLELHLILVWINEPFNLYLPVL